MKNYISKEGEVGILNFQYRGGSNSYSYKYIWSPLADFLVVKCFPTWMAPNLITLIGLLIVLATSTNLVRQTPLNKQLQPLSMLLFSLGLFLYQTLDNIDGKQARRTKSSSPLGMIFDHGCDAFASVFMSLAVGRIVFVRQEMVFIVGTFIGIQLSFYMSVWTQYHSKGVMILGRVNAVDDGIPLCWMLGLISYFLGQQFWTRKYLFEIQNSNMIFYFVIVSAVFQVISFLKNARHEFTDNWMQASSQLFHVALRLGSLLSVLYFTDWYLEGRYFYQIYFSFALPFVRDISYVLICVVTNQKYHQFTNPTIVFILSYPTYILLTKFFNFNLGDESIFINVLLGYFVLEYAHFVLAIVWQISRVLKIKVFKIPYRKIQPRIVQKNPEKETDDSTDQKNIKTL